MSDPTITLGYTAVVGIRIVNVDYSGFVYVEVAGPNTIRVHNTNVSAQSGSVTLMW